jgi:hypothetical protein
MEVEMKKHLPIVLSATALVVAVLGSTPLGEAARNVVPPFAKRSGFATNAGAVNGIKASRFARPGYLVALRPNGKFPISVGQVGPRGLPGPTGPTGPAGPVGPAGAAGAAGAAGVSGYEVVTQDSSPNSSSSQGFTISCPGSKKVLGGGGLIINAASHLGVALDGTGPISGNTGWVVQAHEVNPDSSAWSVRQWAICANVS